MTPYGQASALRQIPEVLDLSIGIGRMSHPGTCLVYTAPQGREGLDSNSLVDLSRFAIVHDCDVLAGMRRVKRKGSCVWSIGSCGMRVGGPCYSDFCELDRHVFKSGGPCDRHKI